MDLVIHHVLEALVVSGAEEDLGLEFAAGVAVVQGLTLVHFSAQRERFLSDRGCIWGCLGLAYRGIRGY